MKINFLNLKVQYDSIKDEINEAIGKVLEKSAFASGPFVEEFENAFAERHSAKYCIGVDSGTAALHIILMALNIKPGDEVIVPTNTFFATAEAVSLAGATPVFVDCEEKFYNIDPEKVEEKITENTKAIIPVHLYGQPFQVEKIKKIAEKHNLYLIEDCAQSHIASYNGNFTGNFGICGAFSFYPGKNLGAYGEAGAVLTNNQDIALLLKALRDHGSSKKYYHSHIGHNYRMDGFQGAVLNVKLKHLNDWTEKRRKNAEIYRENLKSVKEVILPGEMKNVYHVYHLFVVRVQKREALIDYLKENDIFTGIHYPVPCHLQEAYKNLNYKIGDFPVAEKVSNEILSLPMFAELQENEIIYVCNKIKDFYKNGKK